MAANIQTPPSWPALWSCPRCHKNSLNFDDEGDYCVDIDCEYISDFED